MRRKQEVFLSILQSIAIACLIFTTIGIVFDIIHKGNFEMNNYSFTKMGLGTVAIGLGFGVPTLVYENEHLPLVTKTLIHMGVGCVVMTAVALFVGWVPTSQGPLPAICTIAGEIGIAFIVWAFYYRHEKKVAREMTEQIEKMKR